MHNSMLVFSLISCHQYVFLQYEDTESQIETEGFLMKNLVKILHF